MREPLAAEFGCSSRFLAYCLEQDVWERELAQYGIDLWVTGTALANGFRCCQAPLGPRVQSVAPNRPGFREVFQQVVGSAFACLEENTAYWLARGASDPLPVVGPVPAPRIDPPAVDGGRLAESFCSDVRNLQSVLQSILSSQTLSSLNRIADAEGEQLLYPDELWAATVYQFLVAYHRGVMRRDHILQALIPLYLGRTGSFLGQYASAEEADVNAALESLCQQFERSKPALVEGWNQQARGES
jgi:hypothetical protein